MSQPSGVITLLTDFGLHDPFVGVMKASILRRFAEARLVDLSHGVPPQDVAAAAFWLERCYRWFPPGSVHLAVVDPTVGSQRPMLAAYQDGHYFVAPDNGLLADHVTRAPTAQVVALDLAALSLGPLSATFHGRDVFGPVAGMLASGTPLHSLGSQPQNTVPCVWQPAVARDGKLLGQVSVVDHYGNLISNIDRAQLTAAASNVEVHVAQRTLPLSRTYADVADGELTALFGSFGTLEVAQRNGSAARSLGLSAGAPIEVSERSPGIRSPQPEAPWRR